MGVHPDQRARRRIALIAHDNKKTDIAEWARFNPAALALNDLCATGTTGQLLGRALGLPVNCLRSGPLGGDQQRRGYGDRPPRRSTIGRGHAACRGTGRVGARIADGEVDVLIFF